MVIMEGVVMIWCRYGVLLLVLLACVATIATAAVSTATSEDLIPRAPLTDLQLSREPAITNPTQLESASNGSAEPEVSLFEEDLELQELLHWAAHQQAQYRAHTPPTDHCTNCFLVIGIKIKALRGFKERQAIRETWANRDITVQYNTRVVFLGCEPDYDALNATQAQTEAWSEALATEQRVFSDLLTVELSHCQDSYYRLVDKTLGFLQWVSRTHPTAAYVMVTDDDTYVRIDKLTAKLRAAETPTSRYYAGEVWAEQYRRSIRPIRDPQEKNYLPHAQYTMEELPPFAIGPHYVLSVDLVHFLAKNRDDLRGVGTLEDVSMAYWLLSLLHLRPVNLNAFGHLRFTKCHNSLVSFAHLSPSAFHLIHANIVEGGSFCRGFSFTASDKELQRDKLPTTEFTEPDREERDLTMRWDLRWEPTIHRALILVCISGGDESAEVMYEPVKVPYVAFCKYLLQRLSVLMAKTTIPPDFCYVHRTQLGIVLDNVVTRTPQLAPFFYPPLINLQQGSTRGAVFVRMTLLAARTVGTLVECLLTQVYPDAHSYIVDEHEYDASFGATVPDFVISIANESVPSSVSSTVIPIVTTTDLVSAMQPQPRDRAIWISPFYDATPTNHIYIPQASLTFSRRSNHSPADLLSAQLLNEDVERQFAVIECHALRVVAASAAQAFLQLLREEHPSMVTIEELCGDEAADPQGPLFPLDERVMQYSKFKFAVVFDDRQRREGQISDRLVTAFLAGCVPIYYGDVASVRRIFNPRAFIACSDFESLRACARHVLHLHHHANEFNAIRQQPPVTNRTALVEAFSWHPDVANRLAKSLGLATIAGRLKEMIDNW